MGQAITMFKPFLAGGIYPFAQDLFNELYAHSMGSYYRAYLWHFGIYSPEQMTAYMID